METKTTWIVVKRGIVHSSNPSFPDNLENLIEPCILEEENEDLIWVPTTEEKKKKKKKGECLAFLWKY